jgi:hypothetical protein
MIETAKIVIKAFPIAIETARIEVAGPLMVWSNAVSLRHTERKLRNAG